MFLRINNFSINAVTDKYAMSYYIQCQDSTSLKVSNNAHSCASFQTFLCSGKYT